jgi:hypothetical protein
MPSKAPATNNIAQDYHANLFTLIPSVFAYPDYGEMRLC